MSAPLTKEQQRYVALDCEMVGIGPRSKSVLAEVVLVNWNDDILYHSYVTPPEPVTNYRTRYSGILPGVLESEGKPFNVVRSEVIKRIQNKVVVGHGLINDFNILGININNYEIRDTTMHPAFLKANPAGRMQPQKLSKLALDHLDRTIQQGTHNPAEDAQTSMALFRKFKTKLWDPIFPSPARSFASVVSGRGGGRGGGRSGTRKMRSSRHKTRRCRH